MTLARRPYLDSPPAFSEFALGRVVAELRPGRPAPAFEEALCARLDVRAAVTGSSWVLMLATLLEELALRSRAHVVVLAGYSCNEFTKAIAVAGLVPRYVDLDPDLRMTAEALDDALDDDVLAVIGVNNCGVASENGAMRDRCQDAGVPFIEDATYTYLGRDDRGVPFGSFGDYAILNFSEGKIIPIGGGAVVGRGDAQREVMDAIAARLAGAGEPPGVSEIGRLAIYRVATWKPAFTAYARLKERVGVDLKKRLSNEPTRPGEDGFDLVRDEWGKVTVEPRRLAGLLAARDHVQRWGRARRACGEQIVRDADELLGARRARWDRFEPWLRRAGATTFPFPREAVVVKAPFIPAVDPDPATEVALARLGVIRGYSTAYPMCGMPGLERSTFFYRRLFTAPVHRHVDETVMRAAAGLLGAVQERG